MNHWQLLTEEAEGVRKKTLSDATSIIIMATEGISLLSEGLESSIPKDNTAATLVQMALLRQNLNSLFACVELGVQGYYLQSAALLRNVYENWLSTVYLQEFPGEAYRWMSVDGNSRPPKEASMRDKISIPKLTREKLKVIHEELCGFSHTDPISAVTRVTTIENNHVVCLGVGFSLRRVEGTFYGICSWIFIMLELVSKMVHGEETDIWIERYRQSSAQFTTWGNDLHARG